MSNGSNNAFMLAGISLVLFLIMLFTFQVDREFFAPEPLEPEVVTVVNAVEVPLAFACPSEYGYTEQEVCIGLDFNKSVSPLTQAAIDDYVANLGVCQQNLDTGQIVCVPCVEKQLVGWSCIENTYLATINGTGVVGS